MTRVGSTPGDVRDRSSLVAAVSAGHRPTYLFFWGHRPRGGVSVGNWCLSQWWPAPFVVDGETYPTAEHFMMAAKATVFGDAECRQRILTVGDPADAKRLGRTVRGFQEQRWADVRYSIVIRANQAKFTQHPSLRSFLLDTGTTVLVEASPTDRVWGIGLPADRPEARDPSRWPGLNLLGFALMEVRQQLRAGSR